MTRNFSRKNLWGRSVLVGAGVLAAQMACTSLAQAQPDPNDAPKAANPPENGRQGRQGNRGGNPEEMKKRVEDGMRQMMNQAGVNDAPTQDIILAYVKADTEARGPLRQQSMKLFQAVRNGGVTDDQLLALITDYRASQEAEKVRRKSAEADLEAKVHFSKNPRLEAMLLLGGLIGESGGGGPMFMGGGGGGNRRGGQNGGPNAQGFGAPNGQPGQNGVGRQNGAGAPNGQGARGNRPEMTPQQRELIQQKRKEFDKNGDGQLDEQERTAFRQWMRDNRQQFQNAAPNNAQPNGDNPPPAAMPNA
jgi:hypothetical protein